MIRSWTLRAALIGTFVIVNATTPAPARVPRVVQVYLLRLEGHLGARRANDKGVTNLWLNHHGKSYRFQLSRLRVLTGDRLYSSIIAEVQPYRPNFFLRGADTMVQRLDNAAANDRIAITAYWRSGTRDLMVNEVTVSSPTIAPPLPTQAAHPPP